MWYISVKQLCPKDLSVISTAGQLERGREGERKGGRERPEWRHVVGSCVSEGILRKTLDMGGRCLYFAICYGLPACGLYCGEDWRRAERQRIEKDHIGDRLWTFFSEGGHNEPCKSS